jgi:predicted ATPase
MTPQTKLNSIRIKNFKAIRDSKVLKFSPLTVLIGNNGSGKSSVIEALETMQSIALQGIDSAMAPWHGFEHIWNQAANHDVNAKSIVQSRLSNPMAFAVNGTNEGKNVKLDIQLSLEPSKNKFIVHDKIGKNVIKKVSLSRAGCIPVSNFTAMADKWQFLKLLPDKMFEPLLQKRTPGDIRLLKDGSNIAEYLQSIRDIDVSAFDGIVDTLKYVLPYAEDIKPAITTELEKKIYLQLSEKGIPINLPGWLLSTGTVRILALLAVLRHPTPPPLIVIEEIENGLDPRTLHLIVEEIRSFVEEGLGQVLITTHSPYLLDLLPLSTIITVERDGDGAPLFSRPGNEENLQKWAKDFTPGRLYTMGTLTRGTK